MAYTVHDLKNIIDEEEAKALIEKEREGIYTPRRVSNSYKVIPIVDNLDEKTRRAIHRMNSHGSLYYFSVVVLHKHKLQTKADRSKNLHFQMCKSVEKDGVQDVIEIPRDHFKSTIYCECFPIWRCLPFTTEDADLFSSIGYSDEFVLWMQRAHRQNYRWALISEVIHNAIKLGTKIANHYENNEDFKYYFPEVIPDASCIWKSDSLHHKRTKDAVGAGEGTYDFLGIGSALQSRHYDGMIQDDIMGKNAMNSPTVLEDTIEYHKLLVGAMDADHTSGNRDNDELVVGNRWSYNDVNSYIRANESYFNFTTHSALGGCCKLHPYGTPIFPEAFSIEKLERWKKRLGTYLFSCQFLNVPINPAEVKFKKRNLRYFEFVPETTVTTTGSNVKGTKDKVRVTIHHHVNEGDVIPNVMPRTIKRYMIVDPNHSGNEGRCRHAITVTGTIDSPERRIYLLDVWAEATGIDEFIANIFSMAFTWKLDTVWLETIAAQKYLKYHLDYAKHNGVLQLFQKFENAQAISAHAKTITFEELKTPKTKNAKQMRIDGLGPIIERNELWVKSHGQNEFMEELESYPNGQLRDVLDTLGYGPQVWEFEADDDEISDSILTRRNKWERNTRTSTN